jgi:hypothetical protein
MVFPEEVGVDLIADCGFWIADLKKYMNGRLAANP